MALQITKINSAARAFVALPLSSLINLTLSVRRWGKGSAAILGLVACFLIVSGFTYKLALPGRKLSLPKDHVSHPEYKTEWWYYTGHLSTESGKQYGYQITFFRFGLRDRQKETADEKPLFTDLYMAHFAVSDVTEKKFFFRERINRGLGGKAGALPDRYLVWNEDWKVESRENDHLIEVKDRGMALKLRLTSLKGPVLHGQDGLSQKGEGEGRASYYYSLTRLQTEGVIELAGAREKVQGVSWMDHEFGSNQLREDQVGWDWFSIQLDNKTEIMLYLIRHHDGSPDPYSSGTFVAVDGTTRHLQLKDFHLEILERWKSPKSGASYPIKWKVTIPGEDLELEIVPAFQDQELITNRSTRVTYWEGAVTLRGTIGQKAINGSGYAEMTGYAGRPKV
jgi:predicted secreted hydrolase